MIDLPSSTRKLPFPNPLYHARTLPKFSYIFFRIPIVKNHLTWLVVFDSLLLNYLTQHSCCNCQNILIGNIIIILIYIWSRTNSSVKLEFVVPGRGLEPPQDCSRWVLNPVRLPIPPPRLRHWRHIYSSQQIAKCPEQCGVNNYLHPKMISDSLL